MESSSSPATLVLWSLFCSAYFVFTSSSSCFLKHQGSSPLVPAEPNIIYPGSTSLANSQLHYLGDHVASLVFRILISPVHCSKYLVSNMSVFLLRDLDSIHNSPNPSWIQELLSWIRHKSSCSESGWPLSLWENKMLSQWACVFKRPWTITSVYFQYFWLSFRGLNHNQVPRNSRADCHKQLHVWKKGWIFPGTFQKLRWEREMAAMNMGADSEK